MSYADDQSVGKNPSYGASINYYLKDTPEKEIKIHILDDKGQEIRALKGTKESGINRVRMQIYDLTALLEGDESAIPVINAGKELDEKFIAVEENLLQMRLTGGTASQDILTLKAKLHRKITAFAYEIGKSDFKPTVSQYEVTKMHTEKLASYKKQLVELLKKDLSVFNDILRGKNIGNIIVRMP